MSYDDDRDYPPTERIRAGASPWSSRSAVPARAARRRRPSPLFVLGLAGIALAIVLLYLGSR